MTHSVPSASRRTHHAAVIRVHCPTDVKWVYLADGLAVHVAIFGSVVAVSRGLRKTTRWTAWPSLHGGFTFRRHAVPNLRPALRELRLFSHRFCSGWCFLWRTGWVARRLAFRWITVMFAGACWRKTNTANVCCACLEET